MKFPIKEVRNNFIADYKSGNFTADQLVKKYKFAHRQDYYTTCSEFRQKGLLPPSKLSESIKKYWAEKKATEGTTKKASPVQTQITKSQPVTDYRTVYFKDFSVQIHKKAMARLVVDHNNNLHILNS